MSTVEILNDRIARLVTALEYTVATIENVQHVLAEDDIDGEVEEVEEELVTIRALLAECQPVANTTATPEAPVPVHVMQASNGYSIALLDDKDLSGAAWALNEKAPPSPSDAAWARVDAAGGPWPYLFRATWNNRHTAAQVLRLVQERFK